MQFKIGNYKVDISFNTIADNLDDDILCYTEADKYNGKIPGDWNLANDWQTADGKKALEQDLIEGFKLKRFDDIIDIQEGNDIWKFKNRAYTNEAKIELKQAVERWLSMDDRIDINTLEVKIHE